MTNSSEPILVNASPLPDQLWAAVRQAAPAVTTFLLAKGYIDNEMAALLAALGGVLWPIIVGQLKTRRRAQQLATVAASPEVPDHVLTLKAKG